MPGLVTVTRADAGKIALIMYVTEGPVRIELEPKRAALIGSDLLNLALEPVFRVDAERVPVGSAHNASRPVNHADPDDRPSGAR